MGGKERGLEVRLIGLRLDSFGCHPLTVQDERLAPRRIDFRSHSPRLSAVVPAKAGTHTPCAGDIVRPLYHC